MPIWLTVIGIATLIVLLIVKKLPKTKAVAALAVSFGVAYGNRGHLIPRLANQAAHAGVTAAGNAGSHLGGVGQATVGGLICLVGLGLLVHDLWPRHKAKMRDTIIAILLPILAVAAGGTAAHISDQVHTNLVQTANLGR